MRGNIFGCLTLVCLSGHRHKREMRIPLNILYKTTKNQKICPRSNGIWGIRKGNRKKQPVTVTPQESKS